MASSLTVSVISGSQPSSGCTAYPILLIAIAYFSFPIGLLYLVRKKRSIPFDWMFVCFGVFIAACGATHLMEVVTLWLPVYWVSGGAKVITALASLPTAILLTRVVPQVLNLPSPDQLRAANDALRRSEEKFSKAFRSSPVEMVITTLEEGKFLDVNESFERNLGYGRKEVICHTALECGIWVDPGDGTAVIEELKKNGRKGVGNRNGRISKGRRGIQTAGTS
jgi:PAS domain S-box-containing protein